MPKKPTIEQNSRNVLTVRYDGIQAGWEEWVLLMSDNHHDSPHCRRDLETKHLQYAKDREALILLNGDIFDAMQGKMDPRRSLDEVRPEDKGKDYFNRIVEHAADDYGPYADLIALIARGNHETAVLDKTNTDLVSNLVYRLNQEHTSDGHIVYPGFYGGWVRFMFTYNTTKRASFRMKYNHGAGGSAPVTRGTIQTNRQAVYLPDADIVWNGHNHQSYIVPIARERLSARGIVKRDLCWFVRTPGYNDGYGDGAEGYAVERSGSGPMTNGSIWIKFFMDGDRIRCKPIPEIE